MSALDRLRGELSRLDPPPLDRIAVDPGIRARIAQLAELAKERGAGTVPDDLMQRAVRKYWDVPRLDNVRDARLVSFGLCQPIRPNGPCILEDRRRFEALLSASDGIDQWLDTPRAFRRCYLGLLRSYFAYSQDLESTSPDGRKHWSHLRSYLRQRLDRIEAGGVEPEWVSTALQHGDLLGPSPCEHYAEPVLRGDDEILRRLRDRLGIGEESWFMRELILAQIERATTRKDELFVGLLPRLLELLDQTPVHRNRGLTLLLDRYVKVPQQPLQRALRDKAVEWWQNPWLPSNANRWGGVDPKARDMIADWLKSEFIEAFFEKMAKDGTGDKRRAKFWLRHVKVMDDVRFVLGSTARHSRDRDFALLRRKMQGLITSLMDGPADNNAFIMRMGKLVAVEFGSTGNAFYGYDSNKGMPFDLSKPVYTAKNARNSLKHDSRSLWLRHQDEIHGFARWEDMFAARIKEQFGITAETADAKPKQPPAPSNTVPPGNAAPASRKTDGVPPYTRATLNRFASGRGFRIDDLTHKNGNLWVRTDNSNDQVRKMLTAWHFTYSPGKGWSRDSG